MSRKRFYTVPEAARELGVTAQTVHNWRSQGRFPNTTLAGRNHLITAEDLDVVRQAEAQRHVEKLRELGFRGEAILA